MTRTVTNHRERASERRFAQRSWNAAHVREPAGADTGRTAPWVPLASGRERAGRSGSGEVGKRRARAAVPWVPDVCLRVEEGGAEDDGGGGGGREREEEARDADHEQDRKSVV